MSVDNAVLGEWERAEIQRSAVQAVLTTAKPTRTSPSVIARYANPPADTAYALEYALHRLGDATGKRVLDLGCGDGEFTPLLTSHGARVIGLDISTDLLAIARTRIELDGYANQVRPLCGSAHVIPLHSDSVDIVFGMAVLHHLDIGLAAREVHRVLKPGGRAIFKEPMRNSRVISAIRAMIPYQQPDVSPFERPLRIAEIQSFASLFRTFSAREFELPFVSLLRVCRAPEAVQTGAYELDRILLRRLPWLRPYASVLVFEVTK
jgi:SAM-dependent methyltransferase